RGLQHDADAFPPGRAGVLRVDTEHADGAGVAIPVPLEDLDRRRLARAVRAEQPEHLARLDRERDSAGRFTLAVRRSEVGALDGAHSSSSTYAPGANGRRSPVSSSTMSPQSGWWPTATTVAPRPATASRSDATVAPGAIPSSGTASS